MPPPIQLASAPSTPGSQRPSLRHFRTADIMPLPGYDSRGASCPAYAAQTQGAQRSLIAFDVDKTVLHQGEPDELERFRTGIGKSLVRLLRLGYQLAAITGNSLTALSGRFLKALVKELCTVHALELICQVHLFCNGAALYIHFGTRRSDKLAELLGRSSSLDSEQLFQQATACLFAEDGNVKPEYIVVRYAQQCCIPREDADEILKICEEETSHWWGTVCVDGEIQAHSRQKYYIATDNDDYVTEKAQAKADKINTEAAVFGPLKPGSSPGTSARTAEAGDGASYVTSCHVLPVLSFRHARGVVLFPAEDPRIRLIDKIKARMQLAGLNRYVVTPGGRATIDICHHLVNKRSALTWLLRHIGVEGVEQLGEPMGVNTIYFGDEVVLNGNDLPVADVPGVDVFAVNELQERVPFRTNIHLPSQFCNDTGPEATKAVMDAVADFTEKKLEAEGENCWAGKSSLQSFKELGMKRKLHEHCQKLLAVGPKAASHQRLAAAVAAVMALTSEGDGLDDFAADVINRVNDLGRIGISVKEQQYHAIRAQAGSSMPPIYDDREQEYLKELSVSEENPLMDLSSPVVSLRRKQGWP